MSRETRARRARQRRPRIPVISGPSCRPADPAPGSGRSAAPPGPSSCCRCSASARCCSKPLDRLAPACRPNGRWSSAVRPTPRRWPASSRPCPSATSWSNRRRGVPDRRSPWPPPSSPAAIRTPSSEALPPTMRCRTCPLFDAALRTAVAAAGDGWLVTIGLTPTRPETGYRLHRAHRRRRRLHAGRNRLRAERFVEKPDAADRGGVRRLGPLPVEREHVRLASPSAAG